MLETKAFIEAASDTIARQLAEIEREAKRADELRALEHRAFLAETRETLADMRRAIDARLAEVKDGKDGERGEKGDQGAPGEDGDQGPAGSDGADGRDGRDGADADMDALRGHLEELVAAFPIPQDGKDGEPGKDAYPGEVKGVFDPNEAYRARDIVKLNGSSWIAKIDEPGEIPGEGWMQLASTGKRGERGERGPVGSGKNGKDGASPIDLRFDAQEMKFLMTLDDGNILEADFYPVAKAIRGE